MGISERRASVEDDNWHALDARDDVEKRLLPDVSPSPQGGTPRSSASPTRRRSASSHFLHWCRLRWLRIAIPLALICTLALIVTATKAARKSPPRKRPPLPLAASSRFSPQAGWDQRTQFTELYNECAANDWRPGLWTNCTLRMGLNNLRSELAQCMKFAFDAGAGLVLPRIQLRDNATLNAWTNNGPEVQWAEPDVYFDIDRLKAEVTRSCPGLQIRNTYDHTNIKSYASDQPRQWWEIRFGKGEYREHFDGLLEDAGIKHWSEQEAAVVTESLLPYSVWNYRTDSVATSNTFFDMIHWHPRLERIAEAIAYHPALWEPYAGVHLRVEKDVISFWATFEAQSDAYEPWIEKLNVSTIYLACGDASFEKKFQQRFSKYKVVGKWELLSTMPARYGEAAAEMTFDELAILDYVPMLHAKQVYGIGRSSFAYLLGVDRREKYASHYADTLHQELMPEGATLVGDDRTLLLPPILPEYYDWFP